MSAPGAAELHDWAAERARSLGADPHDPALRQLLLASDYAFEQLRRHPDRLTGLRRPPARLELPDNDEASWPRRLREFRHRHSLALIAADLAGAPVEQVYAHSAWLAAHCTRVALAALNTQFVGRHGQPRRADGGPQALLVLALGKLGGAELNFSSDIDLVFAYAESGQTEGPRPLDHDTLFQRLGQRLIGLLGEVTADGFGFRVDMRLRPFGTAGRLALSFAAMEHYYQRDGRDWERYAWIKAQPIAGGRRDGAELLALMRPFIYRRYLDYTAFEGLREMKALIDAEVQRRDLDQHLKLGPGGIREIEFVVQLQQLIRGGREPALRVSGLLPALDELQRRGVMQAEPAQRLRAAYRFLRRLENRLQMLRDEQVHSLPEDGFLRARLAAGLGFPHWDALAERLEAHRAVVREEFTRVFVARESRRGPASGAALQAYWRRIDEGAESRELAEHGLQPAEALHAQLQQLARQAAGGALSAGARARLDRLMPELLAAVAALSDGGRALQRLLQLLQAILRRSSYLALLDEQPAALQRLVQVVQGSALLAERVVAHPLLLDDLLDARADAGVPDIDTLRAELEALRRRHDDDPEQVLHGFNELRQSIAFRIGLATLFRRQPAADSAAQLAALAQALLESLLPLAIADLRAAHGVLPGRAEDAGLALIGYGSLGGEELGFGSDLDLVFLFDADDGMAASDGPRPLDAGRYQLRVVQKLLALLSTLTPAGRLYEADLRLRPDGAKGLLLTSVQSFAAYQHERAWTWEHQALVRARPVAGSARIIRRFERVRAEVLGRARDPAAVLRDVADMRRRMRAELDRSSGHELDLKQGEGALVDLEFLLQATVLQQAALRPALLSPRATPLLLQALRREGLLAEDVANALLTAHALLLRRALDCTLDARPRRSVIDDAVAAARDAIIAAWEGAGLARTGAPPTAP